MVLITFDDGYVDNYRHAYPLLRARGLQGTFFLVSSYVGSPDPPWWDKVAYWIRHTAREHISITHPCALEIPVPAGDRLKAIRTALDAFKSPATTDPDGFLRELEQACDVALPAGEKARIFADWAEVREMLGGGMNIGSHTHSHRLLKNLSLDEQRTELEKSKALLESGLGASISWLAYPVGRRDAFDERSRRLARECGYELAFSDYGGLNRSGQDPYDVLRNPVESEHDFDRFRWRAMVAFHTGWTAL